MAAEVYTPIDEIGMPLPLAPHSLDTEDASQQKDWHHHFHPRRSSVLAANAWGGSAVRNARLQLYDWYTHHIDYHKYYQGPELPETPAQKFGIVVLAAAGYVPAEAIEFKRGKPRIVRMSEMQREYLWASGDLRIGAPELLRKFITEYTLQQNLKEADSKLVEKFVETADLKKRYALGGVLLDLAVEKAVEPLDPFYRTAWKKGLIHRSSAHRPQRFIRTKLRQRSSHKLIEELHTQLAA